MAFTLTYVNEKSIHAVILTELENVCLLYTAHGRFQTQIIPYDRDILAGILDIIIKVRYLKSLTYDNGCQNDTCRDLKHRSLEKLRERPNRRVPLSEHTMFKPLDKKRYFEQIAQLIREKILHENLGEGFKFPPEQQLAKDLNVSRSVLREALRMLDMMGYVDIRKGSQGGIFVSNLYHKPISESLRHLATNGHITIDDLFDVRLQIEPFIAAEAARYARKGDLKKVSALMEDAALHMEDASYLKQKDMEFHLLLAEVSGNPVLSILMKSVIEILREIANGFLDLSFEKELFQIHQTIFRTITQKKATETKKLVRTDILFVKKNLKGFLKTGKNKYIHA